MTKRLIEIYDDILEPHVAEYIDAEVRTQKWQYDYQSNKGEGNPNFHWHNLCGRGEKEVRDNGYEWLLPIWETAKFKYNFEKKYDVDTFKRLYMNAHTYGVEPHMHQDDGDFTMIYYPRMDWKLEWGGGTFVYDEEKTRVDVLAEYRGNRLLVFDAWLPHCAQAVRRECYQLRAVVVFKVYQRSANHQRLDFYKNEN